jgi:hypothetical protein
MEYTNGMAICYILHDSNTIPDMDNMEGTQRVMDFLIGLIIAVYIGWILAQIIIGYLEK